MKSVRIRKKRIKRLIIALLIILAVAACATVCMFTIPYFRVLRYHLRAEKLMTLYDYDRAIEAYDKAVNIGTKDIRVYDGLRVAYISKGDSVYDRDYDKAMGYYESALSISERGLSDLDDSSFAGYAEEIKKMMEDRHQHDSGTYYDVKEPTCSEEGLRELRCNSCGEVIETVPIEKLPHTTGNWVVDTPAECTHTGLKVKKCTVCHTVVESEEIPMLPHEPGEWETERESGCMPGLKVRKCLDCGEVVESEEIPASKNHVKGSWETVKEPDCVTPGEKALKCKNCDTVIETEEIPAKGHNKEAKGEKFEDTDVLIYRCTECGTVLEPESIARVLAMDSLSKIGDEGLFSSVKAEYDEKGKLIVSFTLNEETAITDFGYLILNKTDLAEGLVVTYDQCRNRTIGAISAPRNLIEAVTTCSITDSDGDVAGRMSSATAYYYRVFYIKDDVVYLSDFHRLLAK